MTVCTRSSSKTSNRSNIVSHVNKPKKKDVYIKKQTCSVIDFNDASKEWHGNKKKMPNGMYVYMCGKKTSNRVCTRRCHDKIGIYSGCHLHFMWEEKKESELETIRFL
jgi:hypothetical protein